MGQLQIATFTGVDDHTNVDRLAQIFSKYPFAECGLLLSLSKSGREPRFPLPNLLPIICKIPSARVAIHLCGKLSRQCQHPAEVVTALRVLSNQPYLSDYKVGDPQAEHWPIQRIQINVGPNPGKWPDVRLLQSQHMSQRTVSFILQTTSFERAVEWPFVTSTSGISYLHDCSGGHGTVTHDRFDSPGKLGWGGFAGGISPNNIESTIKHILSLGDDFDFWVDAESGLRDSQDRLDLGAVTEYLDVCAQYIK